MTTSTAFELNVKVRTDLGKGASRRLRRLNDEIPAIIYGGNKEPVAMTIAHNEISHAIENEAFFSHIISLNVGKKSEQVISRHCNDTRPSRLSCMPTFCVSAPMK